jgi:hypothetical protein
VSLQKASPRDSGDRGIGGGDLDADQGCPSSEERLMMYDNQAVERYLYGGIDLT